MKVSIRWSIILGCILLVWGAQLVIMPFALISSRQVMLDHTRDIMENILDLTLEETRNFFNIARGAAHLTERLISSDIVSTETGSLEKLELYFCDQLGIYPQFAGIYFATPSGEFYYVNREPDPAKGVYRFKQISYDRAVNRTVRFLWRDNEKKVLTAHQDPEDRYDPRVRPWYIKAVREKSIIWTDPYLFFSSRKPGITSAGPIYDDDGHLVGVVGVDIELDVLSGFVGKLRVGKTGLAFIINQNQDVIAFHDREQLLYKTGDSQLRLPKLDELDNPLCIRAFEATAAMFGRNSGNGRDDRPFASFSFEDQTYYTMFTRVRADKISWQVGVYIPEEDYLGSINANRRLTLAVTLLVSVLATLAGLMVAGRLIRPIADLDREAQRIKAGDYAELPKIQTGFVEIQRTADSFFEMKQAVVAYQAELREKEAVHRNVWHQLQQARKMEAIGTLAGGIAHDFNNILSGIFGYAELLQAELADDAAAEHVEGIITAGERARDLVRQILAFSFRENRQFSPLDLPDILNEACSLLEASLPANITIVRHIKKACPQILGDATQIHQLALNLMTNSFHAMEERGGTMTVGLKTVDLPDGPELAEMDISAGLYVCYWVADTGVGIPAETMEKIFDPYFTTKPEGKGTGLGLAVIKGIVQGHGGGILARSRPGEGSCFYAYLPALDREKGGTLTPVPVEIQKGDEHILLVDDQKVVLTVEQQILEVLGYEVTTCLSGAQALALFTAAPDRYDLVVTDMTMPGMAGDLLAEELMAVKPGLPVILVTGDSKSIARNTLAGKGIREVIMKPVRLREFSAAIRRALDRGN